MRRRIKLSNTKECYCECKDHLPALPFYDTFVTVFLDFDCIFTDLMDSFD